MNKLWTSKVQELLEVHDLLEKVESKVRKGDGREETKEETREEEKEVTQKTSNIQIYL